MYKRILILLAFFSPPALGQPAQFGHWDNDFFLGIPLDPVVPPISPEHMLHLPTGQILLLGEEAIPVPNNTEGFCTGLQFPPGSPQHYRSRSYLWTPPAIGSPPGSPGQFEDVRICRSWVTCSGHSALGDGRILTT